MVPGMKLHHLVVAALALTLAAGVAPAAAVDSKAGASVAESPLVVAQSGAGDGRLAPRYEPAPIEEPGWYNSDYLFALSRGLADSTIHPAGKAPLFLLTVPIDIIFLPATLIGGFFG